MLTEGLFPLRAGGEKVNCPAGAREAGLGHTGLYAFLRNFSSLSFTVPAQTGQPAALLRVRE